MLFCDGEPGAEIYSAAADRDQATLVFVQAKGMVMQEPELASRAKIYQKAIAFEAQGSSYKAISAEANTKHGYNAHLVVVDETHAQKDSELVDVLETSTGARRQPLIIHITTADYARESICNEKLDYARKVRDGVIEDVAYLPVIYEADREDDWTSAKVWAKANPNLGVSLTHEYLEAKCQKAKDLPRFENTFKRLHLNIQTEVDVRWLSMDVWDECGELPFDATALLGRPCWGGLDLSKTIDLTAFVLVFPPDDPEAEEPFCVLPFFWVPQDNMHVRQKRDRVPYPQWVRQGHIEATPGNEVDYRAVRRKIKELKGLYQIRDIGFDPWNAAHFAQELNGEDGIEMVQVRQGVPSIGEATKKLEALVVSRKLAHGNHPVLRWCASNAAVEEDANGNIRPSKRKSTERIDGVSATVTALARYLANEDGPSVYENADTALWV